MGEIVDLAESLGVRMSEIVIAEAMAAHHMNHKEVIEAVLDAFGFNLLALEIGLNQGSSFLLGTIGQELPAHRKPPAVIGDRFIDKASRLYDRT